MDLRCPRDKAPFLTSTQADRRNIKENIRLMKIAALAGKPALLEAAKAEQELLDELEARAAATQPKLPVDPNSPPNGLPNPNANGELGTGASGVFKPLETASSITTDGSGYVAGEPDPQGIPV